LNIGDDTNGNTIEIGYQGESKKFLLFKNMWQSIIASSEEGEKQYAYSTYIYAWLV